MIPLLALISIAIVIVGIGALGKAVKYWSMEEL